MTLDVLDYNSEAFGLVQHISQILEDSAFLAWPVIRPFSNTVISNIARGKWNWNSEKAIDKCRSNQYMRGRGVEETLWAVPCPLFNRGRCEEDGNHEVAIVLMKHICSFCANSGYENGHTNRACNKRRGNAGGSAQNESYTDDRKDKQGGSYHRNKGDPGDQPKN